MRTRKIAAFLNAILEPLGFELRGRAAPVDLCDFPRESTSGLILEFIGTMGVGKSTLFNGFYPKCRGRWFSRADIARSTAKSLAPTELDRLHREILRRRLNRIELTVPDGLASATKVRQSAQVLIESLFMYSSAFPRGFCMEEGLFKNFAEEVSDLRDDDFALLCRGRALVYVRADSPETVAFRFNSRASKRRSSGIYQHESSGANIHARIERDMALYDQLLRRAEQIGVPTVVVKAEHDSSSNVSTLLKFEEGLRRIAVAPPSWTALSSE